MTAISGNMPTFGDFWSIYPRKIAKRVAEKSWLKELKKGVSPIEIIEGLKRQLPYFATKDEQFIPHASTWLNQARYEDEVQPIRVIQKPESTFAKHQRECRETLERSIHGSTYHAQFDNVQSFDLDPTDYVSH